MTAIKTNPSSLADKASSQDDVRPSRNSVSPSATEEAAKTRFASALTTGVDTLLGRGHGRERASSKLLNEIADECSPDEDEVFQTMESLGISMEDAKKVMTVSSAFRKAQTANNGSLIEAIDEMTFRLKLEDLSHIEGSSRSSSPTPSATSKVATFSTIKMTELTRNESVDSLLQNRPVAAAMAKKGQRPARAKSQQQGRGRKRALAEKTPEKLDSNVMIEEQPKNKGAVADLEVKEKMMNAKLSKATEGKKPKSSSARAKSPEGGLVTRGKRASSAALHAEEAQPKRPRTRSQTEESIPAIL